MDDKAQPLIPDPMNGRVHSVRNWLLTNAPLFVVLKDIVTIVAAFIAGVALIVAATQLRTTANSFKSNAIFQISREGRDLARTLNAESLKDPKVIGSVFNYLNLVWHQHRLGIIDEDIWRPMTAEMCFFIKTQNVESYWTADNKQMYSEGFVNFIDNWSKTCQSELERGRK